MRIARFFYRKAIKWGIVENRDIRLLPADPYKKIQAGFKKIRLNQVKLLPPAVPTKIILVGLNYKSHAKELGMKIPKQPVIFLKPPSSVLAPRGKIIYPPGVKRLDYEAELAIVIKKQTRNISPAAVKKCILGYTCLNDVTARDLQKIDVQWIRAKSFDTFCPLGPWIETEINPSNLRIKTYLNGEIKQNSSTAGFIFKIDYLVSFISKIMTLYPGDIISTGTPPGVGPMKINDIVEIEIESIGRLKNRVG